MGGNSYGYGKGLGDKCVVNNERCVFGTDEYSGAAEKIFAVDIAISHVRDLLISDTDDFILLGMGS